MADIVSQNNWVVQSLTFPNGTPPEVWGTRHSPRNGDRRMSPTFTVSVLGLSVPSKFP